jgi:hypothetical protein
MALLSFRGINTPSLPAQGGQRRFSYFNIQRGNPIKSALNRNTCLNILLLRGNAGGRRSTEECAGLAFRSAARTALRRHERAE